MKKTSSNKVVWVEDDRSQIIEAVNILRDHGLDVTVIEDPSRCIEYISSDPANCSVVIVDIVMPGVQMIHFVEEGEQQNIRTMHGYDAGLVLARWIKRHYPRISVVGASAINNPLVSNWFATFGDGLFSKWDASIGGAFAEEIKRLAGLEQSPLKSFIVHGHDSFAKLELKNYLQNTLGFAEPIILHEQPNLGQTIIEKFESLANNIDFVFVLLTPDDRLCDEGSSNNQKRRARQNVIFELGFFFGKYQRKSGRIFLLYKGELDLPSDISGVVYIDISNGIESCGEDIRKEINAIMSK